MTEQSELDDPRFGIGGNQPPLPLLISQQDAEFGQSVAEFLAEAFADLPRMVSDLLEEARALPKVITTEEEMGAASKLIVRFREVAKRAEAFHQKEKAPYLAGGRAVDVFFFSLLDKVERRDKKAKPGAVNVLADRLHDYNRLKLAAEEERRRQEAAEAARVAREAQEKADREAREAEEKRLAAERARKPEVVEQKTAAADAAEAEASESRIEAEIATAKAQEAHVATLAKPADLVRTRVEGGPTVTMRTEAYALIQDESLLDKEKLWPFIKQDAKEAALRAWAKTTGHNVQMPGAAIGRSTRSDVR